MTLKKILSSVLPFVALFVSFATALDAADKPNVVVILTDDQGWGDLSLNGNTNLSTPNIDQMAADGAQFDRFYVCAVCSPTRAEFLTGRYHAHSGVYSTSAGGERIDLDEMTIAQTFKAAGYSTGAFGKWHNGMQYPYHPNGRGFDEYYGFCSGHWGNYFDPPLEHNGKLVKGKGFIIDDLTDHAIDFIEENKEKPFFAYVPFNTPHSPMQVPDRWYDKFKDSNLEMHNRDPKKENLLHVRAALAMCENIDWNVGRILKKLDELELAEDTIVIYFCDNGPNGTRWNGDMKGRKGSTDEGGVRSPMVIRWPGKISANKRVTQLGAAIDLLPTLADMTGIEVASKKPLNGISLKSALLGSQKTWKDRIIYSHWKKKLSLRTNQFRYDAISKQLFDIAKDPGQRTNIAAEKPAVVKRLARAAETYTREVIDGWDIDERPFVIGHPDFQYSQIPARDGIPHGGIKRSNKFPNCSYFHSWNNVDDFISWEVEVAKSGTFQVELHYTCPEKDTGSKIELSFNDAVLKSQITEAHDPPIKGAEHDRFDRAESYVKDFKAISIGTIELKEGKGVLKLGATEMPGASVLDFRLLMLTRVAAVAE